MEFQVQDRNFTRFLWFQDPTKADLHNNLQVYCFCRVWFASTFLLAATINFHLQQSDLPVAKKVKENIYVDNVITGVDTLSDAKDLYTKAKSLFAVAFMNLREWASNYKEFMNFVPHEDQAGKFKHKVLCT